MKNRNNNNKRKKKKKKKNQDPYLNDIVFLFETSTKTVMLMFQFTSLTTSIGNSKNRRAKINQSTECTDRLANLK